MKRLSIYIAIGSILLFLAGKAPIQPIRTFLFTGDICFAETYHERLEEKGKTNILKEKGYDYSFLRLDTLLAGADCVIGNLETPLTDIAVSPLANADKYKIHKGDIEKNPVVLKRHKISCLSLANNHTMDYGQQGILQTIAVLKKHGIPFFGAGANEKDAAAPFQTSLRTGTGVFHLMVIGGLDYSDKYENNYNFYASENKPGVMAITSEKISLQIKNARQEDLNAFIVAYPHWFENYKWKSERETLLAHAMIDAGADMVIGHGTHMFQEIEFYKGKWILYSLGNFVFNSPGRFEKKNAHPFSLGAMLKIQPGFPKKDNISMELYPIFSDNLLTNYQARLVSNVEFDEVFQLLKTHSSDSMEFVKMVHPGHNPTGRFMELKIK